MRFFCYQVYVTVYPQIKGHSVLEKHIKVTVPCNQRFQAMFAEICEIVISSTF